MQTSRVIIDGQSVAIGNAKNILELVRRIGIELPTFCYHSELSVYGACRLCLVEVENVGLVASCSTPPTDGMVIRTNTERTRRLRRMILELLLANHDRECPTCSKNTTCKLQKLAKQYGVDEIRFGKRDIKLPIDHSSCSIVKDPNKCILCGDCVRVCKEVQGLGIWDFAHRGSKTLVTTAFGKDLADVACINCGQCVAVCPTGALTVKSEVEQAWAAIHDPGKTVVVQIAPAVRVALGEEFGLAAGSAVTGKIVAALKKMGVDKVFDTLFTADLTTIEESMEFLSRLENEGRLPLFTSCCPGWVKYCEQTHADMIDHLSSCRSPQQMFGSLIKKHYAKKIGKTPAEVVCISVMPCTAKKFEAKRPEFTTEGVYDVDIVLTTVEMAQMIKEFGIVFNELEPAGFDNPLGMGSGGALIFGASGGVMESVVRYIAGYTGGHEVGRIDFYPARGIQGLKEAEVAVNDRKLKVAVVNGINNAERLIQRLKTGEIMYHIVEVMACPGGCIGGGGQPDINNTSTRIQRLNSIYQLDAIEQVHKAQDNVYVNKIINEWLKGFDTRTAHHDLHTSYVHRRRISGKPMQITDLSGEDMVEVAVCIGTGCYLRGSYDVLNQFTDLVRQCGLEKYIKLNGTFCLEHCDQGVSVKVGDEIITGVTPQNAAKVFKTRIAVHANVPI
ncbi:NADH-quinone oxidoreductase subunit G [Desulfotomaculum arcticum]|uniref:NADH-quinone oxidoreductase subunit G n=1 Tax=Desulfotruncus arcticus DSM 17038 TaxID=1121424 RepID=A0A1I2UN75_9FIRM|nr:[FeFe] hydrogenase, group A [Desulfotruncus arcticus]SFG77759.1 NADH-quinone oxidoreductase subunit G [Desulfotomaculum arcticum] [Desulfotruncus arcticus DSM 17038]